MSARIYRQMSYHNPKTYQDRNIDTQISRHAETALHVQQCSEQTFGGISDSRDLETRRAWSRYLERQESKHKQEAIASFRLRFPNDDIASRFEMPTDAALHQVLICSTAGALDEGLVRVHVAPAEALQGM